MPKTTARANCAVLCCLFFPRCFLYFSSLVGTTTPTSTQYTDDVDDGNDDDAPPPKTLQRPLLGDLHLGDAEIPLANLSPTAPLEHWLPLHRTIAATSAASSAASAAVDGPRPAPPSTPPSQPRRFGLGRRGSQPPPSLSSPPLPSSSSHPASPGADRFGFPLGDVTEVHPWLLHVRCSLHLVTVAKD